MTNSPSTTLTFEELQARHEAARTLASIEELIWHSNARNESVAQTRLYFEKILMGCNPNLPEPQWLEAAYGDRAPVQPGKQASLQVQARPRNGRQSTGSDAGSGRKTKKARRSLPEV